MSHIRQGRQPKGQAKIKSESQIIQAHIDLTRLMENIYAPDANSSNTAVSPRRIFSRIRSPCERNNSTITPKSNHWFATTSNIELVLIYQSRKGMIYAMRPTSFDPCGASVKRIWEGSRGTRYQSILLAHQLGEPHIDCQKRRTIFLLNGAKL